HDEVRRSANAPLPPDQGRSAARVRRRDAGRPPRRTRLAPAGAAGVGAAADHLRSGDRRPRGANSGDRAHDHRRLSRHDRLVDRACDGALVIAAPRPSSRFTTPEQSPGFLLWRATLAWQRRMRSVLTPHDLTHVQFVLLASLWWLEDHDDQPPTQARLAE